MRGYETLRLEKQGVHLKEERKRKSGEEVPIPVPAGWEEEKSLAFAENPVTIVKKTSVFPERIEEKKYTKCFDCDKIKDGLVLRTRRSGDYLRVTAKGGKKKLKDYMIDAKIPKEERDSILLLADGPEIWWVVGYRRGESGRVGEDTKAVLHVLPDDFLPALRSLCSGSSYNSQGIRQYKVDAVLGPVPVGCGLGCYFCGLSCWTFAVRYEYDVWKSASFSGHFISGRIWTLDFEKRIGDPKLISCEFPVRKEF